MSALAAALGLVAGGCVPRARDDAGASDVRDVGREDAQLDEGSAAMDAAADTLPPPWDGAPAMDAEPDAGGGEDVVACDACDAIAAPRLLAPTTGSHAAARRPLLRWVLPAATTGVRVDLCRDRALRTGCVVLEADGTSARPATDLAPGVWFWGARGRAGGLIGTSRSAVWRLLVGSGPSGGDSAWGGDLDVDGDGLADVLQPGQDNVVHLLLSSAAGSTARSQTLRGPLEASSFGESFDAAGDVNGDGYGDVLIGSSRSDSAYLFYGGASGVDLTPLALRAFLGDIPGVILV